MYLSREFLNYTLAENYTNFVQSLIDAGWELFYTTSASNCTLRSNMEDGLGPWVYINIYYTTTLYLRYYAHWSGATGVCPINNTTAILTATTTVGFRIYCNKNFIVPFVNPYNGYAPGGMVVTRPPSRIAKVVQGPVVGGTSVTLPFLETAGFRVGDRRTIYGIAGEGQREIVVTAIDRAAHTITVTGCSDSYADGALVGDYQLVICIDYSSIFTNQFNYTKLGTAILNSAFAYITAKNGAEGAAYPHDSAITIETAIVKDQYRYLGDINPTYIKWGKSLGMNAVVQIRNSDEPPVDSIPTSFTDFTLTDNTQTWAVDSLIGKCILFISGTGLEYSRVIIGNTDHTLTFRTKLPTITTSTGFRIVDEVYRSVGIAGQNFLCREEF